MGVHHCDKRHTMSPNELDKLTQDTAYDLLSNARRRLVISHLRGAEEPVSVSELSERIAAWENDIPVEELSDQQIKRVYVSLYQIHIPKLDEFGLVDYDKDSGEVALTPRVSELDNYLPKRDQDHDRADGITREAGDEEGGFPTKWEHLYAGIALLALGIYAGVLAFPELFGWVSLTVLNVAVFTAFVVITLSHYLVERWN